LCCSGRLAHALFGLPSGVLPAGRNLFCYSFIKPVSASSHGISFNCLLSISQFIKPVFKINSSVLYIEPELKTMNFPEKFDFFIQNEGITETFKRFFNVITFLAISSDSIIPQEQKNSHIVVFFIAFQAKDDYIASLRVNGFGEAVF
jgi:hypothetical protein